MGLTKSEFEALSEKILGLVEADSAEVWLEDKEDLQLRSANNDITSNGFVDRFKIGLTVLRQRRFVDECPCIFIFGAYFRSRGDGLVKESACFLRPLSCSR